MEKKSSHLMGGVFLIALGILLLILRLTIEHIWPVFILALGVLFWMAYFHNRENVGLLMPGSLIIVLGIIFLASTLTDWEAIEYLWPLFVFAPAAGFLSMYFGGIRDEGLLIPALILTGITLFLFCISLDLLSWWPVLLILAGIILIWYPLRKRVKSTEKKPKKDEKNKVDEEKKEKNNQEKIEEKKTT
jgi:predicted membrane protein